MKTLLERPVVRQLPLWFESLGKRQIKSPKIYLRDSGLLRALLQVTSRTALDCHPKLGASWEGFALEAVLRRTGDQHAYFGATQSGAELDLLLMLDDQRVGVEFKFGDAPTVTLSMQIALQDLRLDRLLVVYPGPESGGRLHDRIELVALADLDQALATKSRARRNSGHSRRGEWDATEDGRLMHLRESVLHCGVPEPSHHKNSSKVWFRVCASSEIGRPVVFKKCSDTRLRRVPRHPAIGTFAKPQYLGFCKTRKANKKSDRFPIRSEFVPDIPRSQWCRRPRAAHSKRLSVGRAIVRGRQEIDVA